MLAMTAENASGESFNIANEEPVSINYLASNIAQILKVECNPKYEEKRAGDIMHTRADSTKARMMLGYNGFVNFNNGLIKTVNSFGYEWKIFQKLYSIYEDQFLDWIYPVKKELFKNKLVLDAGCGTGRHTYFSAKYGAKTIGIDLSEAVDIAFKNTGNLKNVNIIQADIYNAPFREKTFDYIYSIGVLHHLPNPQKGFDCLVNLLKNNKYISVWVYGKENNALLRIADPLRETVLSKLPLQINYYLALILAISLYPIMAMYNLTDIFVKEDRIKSALPQFNFLIYLSKLKFKIIHSIIFDQMLAPIANYYTKSEFEKWFKDAKLKKVYISWRNKNSWRGMGKK